MKPTPESISKNVKENKRQDSGRKTNEHSLLLTQQEQLQMLAEIIAEAIISESIKLN